MLSAENPIASVIPSGVSLDSAIPVPPMSAGACSFFSSNLGTVLFLTGAATVGAGCAGYMLGKYVVTKVGDYYENKFIDDVEKIKKLCELHLKEVEAGTQTFQFPPIFEVEELKSGEKKKKRRVDALHIPKEMLRTKGKTIPFDSERHLAPYHESIRDAIKHLKNYISVLLANPDDIPRDFLRQPNGIAIAIVLYCIEMLDSHCQKFEGYDTDINILDALCNFLINYSDMNQTGTNSRRYSFLKDAYKEMDKARIYLKSHREVRSLREVVNELRVHCHIAADESILNFAKLTNEFESHGQIEDSTKTLIESGIISNFHITSRNFGLNGTEKELSLLESPCRETTIQLAAFAKKVIDPKVVFSEDEIHPVKINIPAYDEFTEYCRLKSLKEKNAKLTTEEDIKYKTTKSQLEKLEKMFSACYNFVTRVAYEEKNQKTRFVKITDYELLIKRAKFISDYADLIQKIIWCQYFCNKILDGIDSLGEIYIVNDQTLGVLEETDKRLGKIMEVIKSMEINFSLITASNNNAMPIPDLNNLNVKTEEDIKRIKKIIKKAKKKINTYSENRKDLKQEFLRVRGDLVEATKITALGMGDVYTPPSQKSEFLAIQEENALKEYIELMLDNNNKNEKKEKKEKNIFSVKKLKRRSGKKESQEDSFSEVKTKKVLSRVGSQEDVTGINKKKNERGSRHSSRDASPILSRRSSKNSSREDFFDSDATLFQSKSQSFKQNEEKNIIDDTVVLLTQRDKNEAQQEPVLLLNTNPLVEAPEDVDPQIRELNRTIDYLTRHKNTRTQMFKVNGMIEKIKKETFDENAKQMIVNLYLSLDKEQNKIKKMIDAIDEKTDGLRHEKIDRMLSIFDEIVNHTYDFTIEPNTVSLSTINEIIEAKSNADLIDRQLSWSLFSTETRTIMNEINNSCKQISGRLFQQRKRENEI